MTLEPIDSKAIPSIFANIPKLSIVFYTFAALSLMGGIVIASWFMPGDPGYGMSWKAIAYIPAITAFTAGFLQSAIFTAIGQAIDYLRRIEFNTRE